MEFRILGPLEVVAGGKAVPLGGQKQRALLALLLINRGEAVSADRLIEELWGGRPPATAAKSVQVYVSQLRKVLGSEILATQGGGYALLAEPEQLDRDRFESLCADGRRAAEGGDPGRAARLLGDALALWRGAPLADFRYEQFAQNEIGRLEEAKLAALEDRIDTDLALGSHAAVVGELEALVRQHPLRERLQRQLMLALYRSGRQADALERYRQARRALTEELGLEPGPELQELERAILAHDPALDAAPKPSLATRVAAQSRLSRGAMLIAGGGLVLLAAAITAAAISSGGGSSTEVVPNSVAVIDARTGKVTADIPVGSQPAEVASGERGIWVANSGDQTISRIDPRTLRVVGTTAPGTSVDGLAAGAGGIWTTDIGRSLAVRIDPAYRNVAARIRIASLPAGSLSGLVGPAAVGDRSVWVGNGEAAVMEINPKANAVRARIDVGNDPDAIAVGAGGVWVADGSDNTVTRIDPKSANAITNTIPVGEAPSAIAIGYGAVWVANSQDDTVARIDPNTGSVMATIPVGGDPTGVAVGDRAVWVANSASGTISRIDPATNRVAETVPVGQSPQSLVVANGRVWVSVNRALAPPAATSTGGNLLRVLVAQDPGDLDPAQYGGDVQRAYETCAGLYNYPDRPAPQGGRVEPEVARGPPTVSDGGRTYAFKVRRGFRFSPPSNAPVTATAFARAIERDLSPKTNSFAATFMRDIVGAKAYIAGRTDHLAGVSTRGNTLLVRLVRPAPDLVARLSTPWFCAVPPDTPLRLSRSQLIPSAGPYYVSSYVPNKSIALRRNPNYGGSRPRRFAEIDYEIGLPATKAVRQVEAGRADYISNSVFSNNISATIQARLAKRYGLGSAAARGGREQYFVEPSLVVYYLVFNANRPPFDDPRLRRAVNFALDRRALAREPFPAATGRPTDQYIPPGMPGFRDRVIYPLGGPDLKRARKLAGHVHRSVVLYTCNQAPCTQLAQVITKDLAAIGLHVEVREFAISTMFAHETSLGGGNFDLATWNYLGDFPDPFDFINLQFDPSEGLLSLFHDRTLERRMRAAAQLTGTKRDRTYAKLDRVLASRAAPAAAYASGTTVNFFSARIGCQLNQPIYGIDLGRLCVR